VRGKHLDDLSRKDLIFIAMSKAGSPPFVYAYLRYAYYEPNVPWSLSKLTFSNTLPPLVLIFVIYDFFYTLLHWFLHLKSVYGYIHKHHHHQKAPSRANVDAVNVHPVEYVLGEYNHLFALYLLTHHLHMPMHIVSAFTFLVIGAFLAGVNHTRYDMVASLFGVPVYDSKAHDVHHRIPQSNYGQYTMLWDRVFGTYR
jgi:sterol desaturase/sphingolipid hydroxylase (fatty acid hydroxylase superfamily)